MKYIQPYNDFLFEADMVTNVWFESDAKFTKLFIDKLNDPESLFISSGRNKKAGIKFKTSDITNIDQIIAFLTKIYNKQITKTSRESLLWFGLTPKHKIKLSNGDTVFLSHINKTESNISDTKRGEQYTTKQELSSLEYIKWIVETNKLPDIDYIRQIYPEVNSNWEYSFIKQAELFKKWIGNETGYQYYRKDGLMEKFNKLALSIVGSKNIGNWQPADVWMCKTSSVNDVIKFFDEINVNKLDTDDIKVEKVNIFLREKLQERILIPISLKQLGKTWGKLEVWNEEGAINDLSPYTVDITNIKCSFAYDEDKGFIDRTSTFNILIDELNVEAQLLYTEGRKVRDSIRLRVKPISGQGNYHYGDVPAPIIKNYLEKVGISVPGIKTVPKPGEWTKNDIDTHIKMFDEVLTSNFNKHYKINFNISTTKEFSSIFNKIIKDEMKKKSSDNISSSLCIKAQTLQYLYAFTRLYDTEYWHDFILSLVLGAQKRLGIAAPFVIIH